MHACTHTHTHTHTDTHTHTHTPIQRERERERIARMYRHTHVHIHTHSHTNHTKIGKHSPPENNPSKKLVHPRWCLYLILQVSCRPRPARLFQLLSLQQTQALQALVGILAVLYQSCKHPMKQESNKCRFKLFTSWWTDKQVHLQRKKCTHRHACTSVCLPI